VLPFVRVTLINTPPPFSLTLYVALLNCSTPGSTSTIVTTAVLCAPSVASGDGLLSVTLNVSSPSTMLSSRIGTLNVAVVCPAMKLSVPLVDV
jgi:hypothetical protein